MRISSLDQGEVTSLLCLSWERPQLYLITIPGMLPSVQLTAMNDVTSDFLESVIYDTAAR
jgi:hypothetical protein